ncbi:Galactose-3-O-sulfotransferase 3 [Holothuria leucospilota]|uniref:Galactose-3-O-sulfotransferase 3 n=1 Tax=Holothuria leucospilota TaxID=206669 RepID=A0A9Q0YPU2_HOLLE|nr:Galactose-3-O-sulfotransferase 3 [Holothuria leucospilota]
MNFINRISGLILSLLILICVILIYLKIDKRMKLKKLSVQRERVFVDYSDSIVVTKFRAPVLPLDDLEEEEIVNDGKQADLEEAAKQRRLLIAQTFSAKPAEQNYRISDNSGLTTENSTHRMTTSVKPCTPKHNVAFLRTHKTGSSTLQAILYRYGELHDLSFALPEKGSNLGSPRLFHPRFIRPTKNKKYNMLVGHARYDKWGFSVAMPRNTQYITIIREPSDQFESLYKYYNWYERFQASLPEFSSNPFFYYKKSEPSDAIESALNPNLFDLGLDKKFLNDRQSISEQIEKLDKDFTLVMVTEYFDESLILLKDLLCWSIDDVTYLAKNVRSMEGRNLNKDTRQSLRMWNAGDVKLYEHFNETFWRKVHLYGKDKLMEEVKTLRERNEELKLSCVEGSASVSQGKTGTRVKRYSLKVSQSQNDTCVLLTLANEALQGRVARRQFGN